MIKPSQEAVSIEPEPFSAADAQALAAEQERELLQRYGGVAAQEAMGLYRSAGYGEIESFGAYTGSPLSRCFERSIEAGDHAP